MFKLLIKGNSVEAAEKSAAKFNVVLENPVLKSNPLGYDDVVALSDSPEKNIAEWFCNTTNVNVPFEEMKFTKDGCIDNCDLPITDLIEEGIYNYFVKCEDNNNNRNSEVNPPEFTLTKTKKLEITFKK